MEHWPGGLHRKAAGQNRWQITICPIKCAADASPIQTVPNNAHPSGLCFRRWDLGTSENHEQIRLQFLDRNVTYRLQEYHMGIKPNNNTYETRGTLINKWEYASERGNQHMTTVRCWSPRGWKNIEPVEDIFFTRKQSTLSAIDSRIWCHPRIRQSFAWSWFCRLSPRSRGKIIGYILR